ncbi:hypothetical protein [Bacillus cereus]|nr:hypothetical protein [Bacillus cereus]MEB2616593.1 hypothetical protein [Bacillus cereus]
MKQVIKMLGLDPSLMMNMADDIRKSLHNAATDMATIRRQNTAIMAHLGIAEPTELVTNDEQCEQRAGSGGLNGAGGRRH